MTDLIYLRSYPETILQQVRLALQNGSLGQSLQRRYPEQNRMQLDYSYTFCQICQKN